MIFLIPPTGTAGEWNLPEEFEHPDAYTMSSDQAQYILEQRGFMGYGQPRCRRLVNQCQFRGLVNQEQFRGLVNQEQFRGYAASGEWVGYEDFHQWELAVERVSRGLDSSRISVSRPGGANTKLFKYDGEDYAWWSGYGGGVKVTVGPRRVRQVVQRPITRAPLRGLVNQEQYRGYGSAHRSTMTPDTGVWRSMGRVKVTRRNPTWDEYANRLKLG